MFRSSKAFLGVLACLAVFLGGGCSGSESAQEETKCLSGSEAGSEEGALFGSGVSLLGGIRGQKSSTPVPANSSLCGFWRRMVVALSD